MVHNTKYKIPLVHSPFNPWCPVKDHTYLNLICIKWVPGDPSTIILASIVTQKMPESSGSMYSSIFMLENI